jgi:RimJ/RimL family protein N-acetyltransferase
MGERRAELEGFEPMRILETARLIIRHLTQDDGEFMLELLNEPGFIQNIADRGVRTIEEAQAYIRNGPVASYAQNGFGLFAVELKAAGVPIGICGLIRREVLPDVDIGYALLERYWHQGYACEAAAAVLNYGYHTLGLKRIVAITAPDNDASARVLEKIGLQFDRIIDLPGYGGESKLFVPKN